MGKRGDEKKPCYCNVCKGNHSFFRVKRKTHLLNNGPMRTRTIPHQGAQSNTDDNEMVMQATGMNSPQLLNFEEEQPLATSTMGTISTNNQKPLRVTPSVPNRSISALNADCPWNDLTEMLYAFQSSHRLSKKSMNDLLKVTERARQFPNERLNMDWRTVLAHKTKHELEVLKRTVGTKHASATLNDEDVFVCSACALTTFTIDEVNAAQTCEVCKVPWVRCSFRFCGQMCVCSSRLGNHSLNSVVACTGCSLSSMSAYTVRHYVFSLKRSIQNLFQNQVAAKSALAPWDSDGRKFFSGGSPGMPVEPNSEEWISEWTEHMRSLPYKSENWHGERFLAHPIWKKHGMRSLLLVLFLDWFPPFDITNPYSVGVMSVGILNYSCVERARTGAIWPIMVLSGPKQLPHMYAAMTEMLAAINQMSINGVMVYDELTKSRLKVHVAVAQVVADRPAASKIGEYKGHSSYFGCHRCHYKASVCAHVQQEDDTDTRPIVFDNENFNPQDMSEDERELISGVLRKMRKGEHLVWLESQLIPPEKLVDEDDLLDAQLKVHSKLSNIPHSWNKTRLNKWLDDQRYNGLSPLVHIDDFSLVHDIVIDGMHLFLKGINLQLAKFTLSPFADHKAMHGNLHQNKNFVEKFDSRIAAFELPDHIERLIDISTKVCSIKAWSLFSFLKIQALIVLENLVPGEVWELWRLMVELSCGLLHTHVSRHWITNQNGFALTLKKLILAYQNVFGVCTLGPNWHLLLHLATDFENWSAQRTHWAFASERLNHELMAEIRSSSKAHVDATIASSSVKYTSMTALAQSLASSPDHTFRRHKFNSSHKHCAEIEKYLARGFTTSKSGLLKGLGGKILKISMGDIVWLCDPSNESTPQNSETNLYVAQVIASSPDHKNHVFEMSSVVGVKRRIGYANTFEWTPNNAEQLRAPIKVLEMDCKLCCQAVAIFNELGFKQVLIPACGNLPY